MTSITPLAGKTALAYDDINLIPNYSEIESRQDISLRTKLTNRYQLDIPLIASPMDTVCESDMAIAMADMGGVGCVHRFMTIDRQADEVKKVHSHLYGGGFGSLKAKRGCEIPIMAAIGANGDYLERAQELVKNGTNVVLIDVAHGYHSFVMNAVKTLKRQLPSHVDVIAGNVATGDAAYNLEVVGADAIRVGIGGGSLCTTRIKTGFGVPNVTSLEDCKTLTKVPIIACGGIRNSGDIAKALAIGASSVILGSLLAGTKEAPGKIIEQSDGSLYKRYRGAASLETKSVHGQAQRNVEGESTVVPFKGKAKFVVDGLLDGLRSALSYAGASTIEQFHPQYVIVTNAGIAEARPHLIR